MKQLIEFLRQALSNGLTSNPSTRRLVFFGFATLGAGSVLSAILWASLLLIGFNDAQRLEYFKLVLDFIEWMFTAGIAASGLTYGMTKAGEKKNEPTQPD